MKGIAIQQIVALATLKKAGITPARDIVMLSTADEENNGTYGIRWMIDNHFADIDAEYVLDEGGFGTRSILAAASWCSASKSARNRHTGCASARPARRHGSQPIPDNANMTLLAALQKAMALPESKPHPVIAEMRQNVGGARGENKYRGDSEEYDFTHHADFGVGSPVKVNVIPSSAEATLDCRLLPGVNAEEFVSEMKARINDPRIAIEAINQPEDPGTSNSRTPLFAALRRAILKTHPMPLSLPCWCPMERTRTSCASRASWRTA
jgi:acetylornithine deacetylase/succinyl-diaminopimelate desuccinylase-like protein